jgi:hypothetical protein
MTRGRPWLRLKVAASLDGKTALNNGVSQWITGPAARRDAHAWRARSCAVLTGIGTVKDDNPRLTVREVPTSRQPLRVVIDSRLGNAAGCGDPRRRQCADRGGAGRSRARCGPARARRRDRRPAQCQRQGGARRTAARAWAARHQRSAGRGRHATERFAAARRLRRRTADLPGAAVDRRRRARHVRPAELDRPGRRATPQHHRAP